MKPPRFSEFLFQPPNVGGRTLGRGCSVKWAEVYQEGLESASNWRAYFRQRHNGMNPAIPKEQSMNRHPHGISRTCPMAIAKGTTRSDASIPKLNNPE